MFFDYKYHIFDKYLTNIFPWIFGQCFTCPKQLWVVLIKIGQNLVLYFFVILEILNAMDRPIVQCEKSGKEGQCYYLPRTWFLRLLVGIELDQG